MSKFLVHSDKTDVGRVRSANEDFHLIPDVPYHHCYIVCDGMGGHVGGAKASRIAASVFAGSLTALLAKGEKVSFAVDLAIRECNAAVYNRTLEEPELKGMGTTIVALVVNERGEVWIGHVGDSRIYRYRGGQLQQVTRDDSFVQDLIDRGQLKEEDREKHPERSRITKAIGIDGVVEPTVCNLGMWQPGDRCLLCSDGLTGVVEDAELAKEAFTERSQAVDQLLGKALLAGAPDNVTLILVEADRNRVPLGSNRGVKRASEFLTRTVFFAPNWAWLASVLLSLGLLMSLVGPGLVMKPLESPGGVGGPVQYVCLDEQACNYFREDTVLNNARSGGACLYAWAPCLICTDDTLLIGDEPCVKLHLDKTRVLNGELAEGSWVYIESDLEESGNPYRWAEDGQFQVNCEDTLRMVDVQAGRIVNVKTFTEKSSTSDPVEPTSNKIENSRSESTTSSKKKNSSAQRKVEAVVKSGPKVISFVQTQSKRVEVRGFGEEARLWNSKDLARPLAGQPVWHSQFDEESVRSDVFRRKVYELRQENDSSRVMVYDMNRGGSVSNFQLPVGNLSEVRDFEFLYFGTERYFGLLEMGSGSPFLLKIGSSPVSLGNRTGSTNKVDYTLCETKKGAASVYVAESRQKRPGVTLQKCPIDDSTEQLNPDWTLSKIQSWAFVHTEDAQVASGWSDSGSFWEGKFLSARPELDRPFLALDDEGDSFLYLEESIWHFREKEAVFSLDLKGLSESGRLRHVVWEQQSGVLVLVFEKCFYTGNTRIQ